MTDSESKAKADTAGALYEFVGGQINRLEHRPNEKAVWRHAFARGLYEGQSSLKAWSLLQRDIPDELLEKYPAGKAEIAAYIALAAYAACGSHKSGISLGEAAGKAGGGMRERFTRVELSADIESLWANLKAPLRIISSKGGSGIDYRLLAKDVFYWQKDSLKAAMYWERNYYRDNKKNKEED